MANNIMVERETFESHGKEYYSYFIKGVVRGKEIKIQVAPPNKDTDKNGYNVLDVVFGDAMEAELVVVPYEMKDDHGKVVKGNTYAVRFVLTTKTALFTNARLSPRERRTKVS